MRNYLILLAFVFTFCGQKKDTIVLTNDSADAMVNNLIPSQIEDLDKACLAFDYC